MFHRNLITSEENTKFSICLGFVTNLTLTFVTDNANLWLYEMDVPENHYQDKRKAKNSRFFRFENLPVK